MNKVFVRFPLLLVLLGVLAVPAWDSSARTRSPTRPSTGRSTSRRTSTSTTTRRGAVPRGDRLLRRERLSATQPRAGPRAEIPRAAGRSTRPTASSSRRTSRFPSCPRASAAFAEPVQNRMVLPIDLPPDKLYQLIAHELTHIFEYSMFFEGYLGRALRLEPADLADGRAGLLPGRGRGQPRPHGDPRRGGQQHPAADPGAERGDLPDLPLRPRDLRLHRAGTRQGGRAQLPLRVSRRSC